MKKAYIIKDASKKLLEQINNTRMIERTAMSTDPITNPKGLSAVIPEDNDGYCTVYKMDCTDGLGLMTVQYMKSILASRSFTTILKLQAANGMDNLVKAYWRLTIAGKVGRAAAC